MGSPATNVLSAKDVNTSMASANTNTSNNADGAVVKPNIKSMEYHRQLLKSKMEEEKYETTTIAKDRTTTGVPTAPSHRVHQLKHLPADPGADPSGNNRMKQYTSPSDEIMSPCTAKLSALKGRQAGKSKPKSLFAQASSKKLDGENVLGAKSIQRMPSPPAPQGNPSDGSNPLA